MRLTILACVGLAGCMSPPEQKLGDGQAGCQTFTSIYGSVSSVVARADNVGRGATQSGKTRITCGSATMEIDSTIGVAAPVVKP